MDVYLDYNATAPLRSEVASAMISAYELCGNASSVHRFGRLARRAVEDARETIAAVIDAAPAEIVFTSGGTEANNLALRGSERPVFMSAIEHDSVRGAPDEASVIRIDQDGVVDLHHLEELLSAAGAPALVSVMLANNETGVVQPIGQVVALAQRFGALVHCDGVQALGKMPLSFAALGVDMMSLSAHKLGGPQGVGALIVRDGIDVAPLLRGGGQERSRRAGTENVAGISGFGAAAALVEQTVEAAPELERLRDDIETRVRAAVPDSVIYGARSPRLPNTSCIGLPGVSNEVQVMTLDLAGVAISAGSACSSGKLTPSHVLQAMGADDEAAASAIRVSLGWQTSAGDGDRFVEAWSALANRRVSSELGHRSVA
ncbi:MAG: cysteine desulfurase [Alphaproteobacteria bacterium]|jgi:cysteine desulfurase